jgi:hypothetical protein
MYGNYLPGSRQDARTTWEAFYLGVSMGSGEF